MSSELIVSLAMPTKVIRRTYRVLAHVVCRPMHPVGNTAVCEQAPTADFVAVCAWLVIRQIEIFSFYVK